MQNERYLEVVVRPRAGKTVVTGIQGEAIKVSVKEAPEDGRANEAVCALIARELGLPRSAVRVSSGHSSRKKLLALTGATLDSVSGLRERAQKQSE